MSWNDKSGELIVESNHDYFADFMRFVNNKGKKVSSYKYALVKSLLDNIFNFDENYNIKYTVLNYTFSKIYWNLIVKYKLPQITPSSQYSKSGVEKIIDKMLLAKPMLEDVDFDSVNDIDKNNYIKEVYKVFKQYVIGALYDDFQGHIYGFDTAKGCLYINKDVFEFIIKNKSILEKVNYYSWIIWMEASLERHELLGTSKNYVNIASKLDEASKRENLLSFKIDLISKGEELRCFYCDKEIKQTNCHLDHFIPWKFVKDDQLWNLVMSCPHCNESKNDKMPNIKYLDKIIIRNEKILGYSFEDKLRNLYNSAIYNGFEVWNKK